MFMLYRYITNSCSGATIPARSEKKRDMNLAISADSAPVNLYQMDRRSTYVLTIGYWTMFLDSFIWCTFPIGSYPCSHGIIHAFTAPSVRFHHVLRVCTTFLLCPQYVNVLTAQNNENTVPVGTPGV